MKYLLVLGIQSFHFWQRGKFVIDDRSGDGTARIWTIEQGKDATSIVLEHHTTDQEHKDVTTMDWSPNGEYLATGSYDGIARIWTKSGTLSMTLKKHMGPVFSIKYNKAGTLLLSASADKTTIIWDSATGDPRQVFSYHTGPALDVDWKSDVEFASSGADHKIYIGKLGSIGPIKQFFGHKDEVNTVKWSPDKKYLASCSDDRTAKVWTMDKEHPILDLSSHSKEIYTIRWISSGEHLMLATYVLINLGQVLITR